MAAVDLDAEVKKALKIIRSRKPFVNVQRKLTNGLGDWVDVGPPTFTWITYTITELVRENAKAGAIPLEQALRTSLEWRVDLIEIIERHKNKLPDGLEAAVVDLVGHLSDADTEEDWYWFVYPIILMLIDAAGLDPSEHEDRIRELVSSNFSSWLAPSDESLVRFADGVRWAFVGDTLDRRSDTE